ncbi:IS4 family transposase [Aeromonas media]|uniref:IS4 family transposase n=1 Tax=Aeromonas media TaxID=651 RepID=UPI00384C07CC
MPLTNPLQWAKAQFGQAELKDPRRRQRLLSLAASLAAQPGAAVSQLLLSPAEMEGAYRFIRNPHIQPDAIAQAGFRVTAAHVQHHVLLLALEDTTALSFRHQSVKHELGHTNQHDSHRALQAHSVLLFSPIDQQVVGLIAQKMWVRDSRQRGQRHQHATRPYQEKESYKWEETSREVAERLGSAMDKVISVCDREADIYEYLLYKRKQRQRFVVRSMQSRCIEEHAHKLYDYAQQCHSAGTTVLSIPQKGGRQAREATLDIRYAKVTLKAPANKSSEPAIPLYYVSCLEQGEGPNKLAWHLLTSEEVSCAQQAKDIIRYYERRWLIEDYHKVWKSAGTRVEGLRMQSRGNLERMSVILAFIAVRLLQLRFIKVEQAQGVQRCDKVLSTKSWKLLWLRVEKTALPVTTPDMNWAYRSLARLGGWKDTKRTGRACINVLWEGWFKLQTILEGYELALSLDHEKL